MGVTDGNTERLMPLEEEFCCLEFQRGGVPLSGPVRAVPGLVWTQKQWGEAQLGACVNSVAGHCLAGTSPGRSRSKTQRLGFVRFLCAFNTELQGGVNNPGLCPGPVVCGCGSSVTDHRSW